MTLPGAIDFSIQRHGSFFDHYRLLSDDFETLVLQDDDGSIAGMASLVFREGVVLGEKQTWGYATDLRIAPTRKAIAQWAQYFLPVLERATTERRCRYIFSALELHDNQAYNALIRPTSHARRRLPRYLLANRFRVIAVHGRVPLSERPLGSIQLKSADLSDLEQLCDYWRENAKLRPLAALHTPDTFLAELKRWQGMQLSDLRIARDSKGNIRGCAALYNARKLQSLIPTGYRGFANTLKQMLSVGSLTRVVRAMPNPGSEFEVKYLTHLSCDTAEIFHRLLDDAYSRLTARETLAYLHFRGNWRTLPPNSFVASSLPFGFYMILPPNQETPPWPVPSVQSLPPDFEAAWL
jgi:hypothetical protein